MSIKEINSWFNDLDSRQLLRMFPDVFEKNMGDVNDFIDTCDEMWNSWSEKDKRETYNHFANLVG